MLKMAKMELELITDPEIYIFFEKGMRGGVSYISNRYSETNNNYLKSHDPKQESKQLYTSMQIIYMVIKCLSFFQQAASNG